MVMKLIDTICKKMGVSRSEFVFSFTAVILGGVYLLYTYILISVCH